MTAYSVKYFEAIEAHTADDGPVATESEMISRTDSQVFFSMRKPNIYRCYSIEQPQPIVIFIIS